jgi:hypothetical protein
LSKAITPLIVLLAFLAVIAAIVAGWSLVWDLKAYRGWKREQEDAKPRWKRRQQERAAQNEEKDARRWRWHILALQCTAFGFIVGFTGMATGYVTRTPWLMISGGNLVFLGVVAWLAYNLILPKPQALRAKRLPGWLSKKGR